MDRLQKNLLHKLHHSWWIIASRFLSTLARFQLPSISLYGLDFVLQAHRNTCSRVASTYISKSSRSWCGESVHFSRHSNGICENEQFWLQECRKRVRGYERVPSCEEPHKLHWSVKPWQECMRNHSNTVPDEWREWADTWHFPTFRQRSKLDFSTQCWSISLRMKIRVVYTYNKVYDWVGPPFLRMRVETLDGMPSIHLSIRSHGSSFNNCCATPMTSSQPWGHLLGSLITFLKPAFPIDHTFW